MSTFDSDDLETIGYFLPDDSQFRLKKLREYLEFLSHLAQPRIADEEREGVPEIRPGEVAICLELLAEQIAQVLDGLSWPAERGEKRKPARPMRKRDLRTPKPRHRTTPSRWWRMQATATSSVSP